MAAQPGGIRSGCIFAPLVLVLMLLALTASAGAAVVHGTVTDLLGVPVRGAQVVLYHNGSIVAHTVTGTDGSYQITSGESGRFYVLVSAGSFKQVKTQSFFAGVIQGREMNVVLEPAPVRQEVVVSATGTPTPQAQLGASVSVQRNPEFRNQVSLAEPLRQTPGVFVVQQGQYGGLTSVFVRGGSSDSNKINLDGVPIEDIGGVFDFSEVATMGIGKIETYRGPNSALYGSGAASSVIDLETPRGSTPFPSLLYEGGAGNLSTFRQQVQLGGTRSKLDYYGGYSLFQSANDIPLDEYHDHTTAANLGYALGAGASLRVTARNSDSAEGTPGPIDFYGIPNAGKQSDQDTYLSGSIEDTTLGGWHNLVRYGMVRKREQGTTFLAAGIPITTIVDGFPVTNYYGNTKTIAGANGYSVRGRAVLNFEGVYPNTLDLVSNRDLVYVQSDDRFNSHIGFLAGFRFENERGRQLLAAYGLNNSLNRDNYDGTAQLQGGFKNRVYYTLGGGVEGNGLFGVVGTPQFGIAYYPVRPGHGLFHGTKVKFSFAKGYQEPSLDDQFGSLYAFLLGQSGGRQAIERLHVRPIGAEDSRAYEGGVEQDFWNERGILRVNYFHTEYSNQIELVPPTAVPELLPNLTPAELEELTSFLVDSEGVDLNSMAFRAQGFESEVEFSLMPDLFLRGGYTYLDAVVQHSFSSDALEPSFNTGPPGGPAPSFSKIPIGAFDPLRGARPFRRPPHTGFTSVTYHAPRWSAQLTGAYASRSDDSTFLAGSDLFGGNSLLLPNRNLDHSYVKLDLGGTVQLRPSIGFYAQVNNLTDNQHIGPIGFPALPLTFRAGLRLALGHAKK